MEGRGCLCWQGHPTGWAFTWPVQTPHPAPARGRTWQQALCFRPPHGVHNQTHHGPSSVPGGESVAGTQSESKYRPPRPSPPPVWGRPRELENSKGSPSVQRALLSQERRDEGGSPSPIPLPSEGHGSFPASSALDGSCGSEPRAAAARVCFPGGQRDAFKASSGSSCSCSGLTFSQPWADLGIMCESPTQRPARVNALVSPEPGADAQPHSPRRSRNGLEADGVTFRLLSHRFPGPRKGLSKGR